MLILFAVLNTAPTNFPSLEFWGKATGALMPSVASSLWAKIFIDTMSVDSKCRIIDPRNWSNPLPGSRAFSQIAPNDMRINLTTLKSKYSDPLPQYPKDQNQLWYKILKEYQDDTGIKFSHKRYLFLRDATSLALIWVLVGSISTLIFLKASNLRTEYWIFLGLQFAIIWISARNAGTRFVANVLAVASS